MSENLNEDGSGNGKKSKLSKDQELSSNDESALSEKENSKTIESLSTQHSMSDTGSTSRFTSETKCVSQEQPSCIGTSPSLNSTLQAGLIDYKSLHEESNSLGVLISKESSVETNRTDPPRTSPSALAGSPRTSTREELALPLLDAPGDQYNPEIFSSEITRSPGASSIQQIPISDLNLSIYPTNIQSPLITTEPQLPGLPYAETFFQEIFPGISSTREIPLSELNPSISQSTSIRSNLTTTENSGSQSPSFESFPWIFNTQPIPRSDLNLSISQSTSIQSNLTTTENSGSQSPSLESFPWISSTQPIPLSDLNPSIFQSTIIQSPLVTTELKFSGLISHNQQTIFSEITSPSASSTQEILQSTTIQSPLESPETQISGIKSKRNRYLRTTSIDRVESPSKKNRGHELHADPKHSMNDSGPITSIKTSEREELPQLQETPLDLRSYLPLEPSEEISQNVQNPLITPHSRIVQAPDVTSAFRAVLQEITTLPNSELPSTSDVSLPPWALGLARDVLIYFVRVYVETALPRLPPYSSCPRLSTSSRSKQESTITSISADSEAERNRTDQLTQTHQKVQFPRKTFPSDASESPLAASFTGTVSQTPQEEPSFSQTLPQLTVDWTKVNQHCTGNVSFTEIMNLFPASSTRTHRSLRGTPHFPLIMAKLAVFLVRTNPSSQEVSYCLRCLATKAIHLTRTNWYSQVTSNFPQFLFDMIIFFARRKIVREEILNIIDFFATLALSLSDTNPSQGVLHFPQIISRLAALIAKTNQSSHSIPSFQEIVSKLAEYCNRTNNSSQRNILSINTRLESYPFLGTAPTPMISPTAIVRLPTESFPSETSQSSFPLEILPSAAQSSFIGTPDRTRKSLLTGGKAPMSLREESTTFGVEDNPSKRHEPVRQKRTPPKYTSPLTASHPILKDFLQSAQPSGQLFHKDTAQPLQKSPLKEPAPSRVFFPRDDAAQDRD